MLNLSDSGNNLCSSSGFRNFLTKASFAFSRLSAACSSIRTFALPSAIEAAIASAFGFCFSALRHASFFDELTAIRRDNVVDASIGVGIGAGRRRKDAVLVDPEPFLAADAGRSGGVDADGLVVADRVGFGLSAEKGVERSAALVRHQPHVDVAGRVAGSADRRFQNAFVHRRGFIDRLGDACRDDFFRHFRQ